MKYLFITIAIILSTSAKVFAQVPAETIPDFIVICAFVSGFILFKGLAHIL